MSELQNIKAKVDQLGAVIPYTNGNLEYPTMSSLGQLFTADWQTRLAMAGLAYTLDLGEVAATAYTALTGNAAPDLDQPEVIVAIDSGWLIPMEIDIAVSVNDDDAYDDVTDIMFIADRAATVAAGITATVETALNLLDGGDAFGGRCYSIATGSCGSPTSNDVLLYRRWMPIQLATETGGTEAQNKHVYKSFTTPRFLKGPCAIIGYVTGTNTPTFIGNVVFAHLPAGMLSV